MFIQALIRDAQPTAQRDRVADYLALRERHKESGDAAVGLQAAVAWWGLTDQERHRAIQVYGREGAADAYAALGTDDREQP